MMSAMLRGAASRGRLALAAVAVAVAAPAGAVEIQPVTSPAGTDFWLVEEQSIPIIAVELTFDGGTRLDPDGKAGLGKMVAALFDDGAGELDATAFAKARDAISARFGFGASRDEFSVSARMLAENRIASAELLASALTEPRYDVDAVERVRAQMLSSLSADETNPNAVAGAAWYARAFPDHPYSVDPDGTSEAVAALTIDDLKAHRPAMLGKGGVTVSVVGAVTAAEAGEMVDIILAGLPDTAAPEAPMADAPPPGGVEIVELDVPQSVAVFGQKGLSRDDPDFIPAFVMNHIMGGGGFSSRLMQEVREKRGLAYGVYSYLSPLDGSALMLGSVQTANERIAESLEVIRAEWTRMAEGDVTEADLERAKKYLTGAFPLRFDSNAKIARFLTLAQRDNLGLDYINERNGLIEAVTLDDIKRVAARLLTPDQLSIIVVGKPAGL